MIKVSNRFIDKLIILLTTIWLVSFTIFSTESWGKYVYLLLTCVIFIFGALRNRLKVSISIEPFHIFTFLFLIYGYMSYLWAIDGEYTIRRMTTVAQTLFCMYLVYTCYRNDKDTGRLLDCVMWAGYFVAMYAIYYYDFATIRAIVQSGGRIDNEFANVNAIGMMAAYALIITFSKIINGHRSVALLFSLPALLMIIASGSRKAFIILLIGFFLVYLLRSMSNSKNAINTITKIVLLCGSAIVLVTVIWSMPIFAPITERLSQTLNQFTGSGMVDESTLRRAWFIEIGFEQFLKTPLHGIGIGNSLFIIGHDTYLHNNYIEILACGGILGFIAFYSSYMYCAPIIVKSFKKYNEITVLCSTFLILQLVMDFMQVSYFSKDTFFYFMIFFLQKKRIRNKAITDS